MKKKDKTSQIEKIEKKRTEETDERIKKLYQDEFTKQRKMKELGEKSEKLEFTEVDSLYTSNKIVLSKFDKQYNNEISLLEKNSENAPILKLNLVQFCIF